MVPFLVTYKNLLLHLTLSLSITFFLTFLKIPILFLYGLFTYIHPENLAHSNGPRAAIRRPSDPASGLDGYHNLSSKSNLDLKKRNNKSKDKFEFDENNAQIFRLKLDESHLQSRLYFTHYRNIFSYSLLAISSLLLQFYLHDGSEASGVIATGNFIPLLFGLLGVCKIFVSLGTVSFEKSASKRSDKQLSVILGVLGFVLAIMICFNVVVASVFDFDFGSIDGLGRFFVAVLMGLLAGFLFMISGKIARSFWLGTDQLRCNMNVISCGWFARMVLYANNLMIIFTALLWINPLAEILVRKNVCSASCIQGAKSCSVNGNGEAETLVGNVGMSEEDFVKFRLWCLFTSGILQLVALRSNLQMFLNEAVLSWYQRLHASKVPDLDFSRAKVFLHNHFLCLAVVQFIGPPLLVLLSLGLSQSDGKSFESFLALLNLAPCAAVIKEMALFMAWWVVFVSAVFTSANLVMYRQGTLYVS